MRDYIKEQLKKCNFVKLPDLDTINDTILIKKYSLPKYELNKCYIINIAQELVNNNDSILATNWNNGYSPKYEYLKIFVSKTLGKMIYVDSIYYDLFNKRDLDGIWSGWLPIDNITQIAEVKI